jgi:hypothetical protein
LDRHYISRGARDNRPHSWGGKITRRALIALSALPQALRRCGGIPYSRGEIAELQKEAATAGIAPLAVSQQPLDHDTA